MRLGNWRGLHWHWHWQNLDDDEKRERAEDALTDALRAVGALSNDRWRELSAARSTFADRLRGRLGHGWRNGRAWLTFYRGDPNSSVRGEGRRLVGLHAQWLLLKRQHSIGVGLDVGGGDGNDEVMLSIRVPGAGVYLSCDGLPRWAQPRRPYGKPKDGVQQYLPAERELAISWHHGSLWVRLWSDPHESHSRGPFWDARSPWRQFSIDPARLLLGRERSSAETLADETALLGLPEGVYPVRVTIERRTWWRARLPWRRRSSVSANVESEAGIPIPGKGENAWDCGDDAYYSIGMPAETVAEAVGLAAQKVLETRRRYGGEDWRPPAKAVATIDRGSWRRRRPAE